MEDIIKKLQRLKNDDLNEIKLKIDEMIEENEREELKWCCCRQRMIWNQTEKRLECEQCNRWRRIFVFA